MSTQHSNAAEAYLQKPRVAKHHDQTFYGVRQKRDRMAQDLPEWEDLREAASQIKKHTITHLADYLEQFEQNAVKNGVHVHWAKDAQEYNAIVLDILQKHQVKKVVKSKSMLTEECHLNENLERSGIEVIETDLGERILQMMKLAPSHIVMPALHVHREDIGATFRRLIPNYKEIAASYAGRVGGDSIADENDPTFLTYVARMHLRQQFMEADAGMTGANFGVAETGDVVVCTNEGNADMSTSIPKLHIVLVDNGRSSILSNQEHWQTLKCMRCGACMNTCPVYRRSAGYSYTYFIPGPIGINLGMLRDPRRYSDNVSACSLCCSCDNVCPAKVDLSAQVYRWRQQLDSLGKADPMKKYMSVGMSFLFNRPQVYTSALRLSPLVNWLPGPLLQNSLNPWAYAHRMMKFPPKSFHQLWKEKKL